MIIAFLDLLILAAAPGALDGHDTVTPRVYRGAAVDLQTGAFLYTEEHAEYRVDEKRTRLLTTFRDASGRIIAERTVDYSPGPFLPIFRLEDSRTGYVEGAEPSGDDIRLFWRPGRDERMREKTLAIPSPAVVDAGFNDFVQEHWDEIMGGKTKVIHFGVPSLLDHVRFRLVKEGVENVRGRSAIIVRCEVDNFLLRMFVDPIIVSYDPVTRRLLRYEGISNISDNQGNSQFVRIDYDPVGP